MPKVRGWEGLVWNNGDLDPKTCSLRCCKVAPGKRGERNQVGDRRLDSSSRSAALLCDPE